MRFRVEHFRAVEAPETPLGYAFAPTGRVDEVDAHDEAEAAATVLAPSDDTGTLDVVSFDPGNGLYAFPGEDEAVRVVVAG
jgi:hypothetical protein